MRLDDVPRELLAAVAVVAALVAASMALRRWIRRARARRRFARASEGEREAAALLEAHGFRIEGAQVAASYAFGVDGEPVGVSVRADYVVSRGGERFVAEVKTGRVAPRVETPATRRQLLEYHYAFGVSGVLLVDADARRVHRVDFSRRATRVSSVAWVLAAAIAALAALAALR